jgi:transcription antitermination factor NusG
MDVPHYGPVVARRYRSPQGRIRTSHIPLFSNYVFVYGNEAARYKALTTECVSRWFPVPYTKQLTEDLRQIRDLIAVGEPLTPESRLWEGSRVRVLSGSFQGFEGVIVRRQNATRLLVAVEFMQQGASVLLDDCQLDPCE